uniref:protein-tyrosine-phosphatase n=1 Tax=Globodera rostochiensis TaxID=31243 RepID=A0A914I7S7_GLORO
MSIRRSRIIHRRHAPQNRCVSSLSQCSTTATAFILPTTSPSSSCDCARLVISSLTYFIGTGLTDAPLFAVFCSACAAVAFCSFPSSCQCRVRSIAVRCAISDGISSRNIGIDGCRVNWTTFDEFAHSLRIEKDHQDPSRLLDVFLPQRQSSISSHFRQFIARVTDISIVEESRMRDANRTFLASLADSSVINVHGLNPGHKYSVAILGRREAESILIREDQVLMDPVPLDFGIPGNSSAILATATNITMRAQKPDRALQDTFRVEYHQLDPLKRFPILDVHDIQEQREVELYLGNLSPGRDYAVSITSLREELPSQPWRGIVTTKPLRPVNLSVVELNTSCVLFSWLLPFDSGADRFKIAYGMLHGPNSMLKLETAYPSQQTELCQHIVPGRVFIFAVIAEKSRQISEPATLSHTVRPLAPRELSVQPDFEKARFRVRAHLAPDNESHTEKCQLWVEPEQGGRLEQTVQVQQGERHCEALFELFPGRRYEISAAALSGQSTSTRVLRNKPVEPGFDFAAFGLSLREGDVGSGTLRLEWPQSEVARLRIADLWARIVGRDSHLHFSIQPLEADSADQQQQVETGPTEPEPVLIDGVREGACYKVLLYTVTSSGIVSEQRFEQFIRVRPPQLDLTVGQLSARSTTLQAFLYRPKHHNNGTSSTIAPRGVDETPSISAQCHLHVVVTDALDSAEPFHKYVADAQVNCGEDYGQKQQQQHGGCAPKFHQLNKLEFRTQPAQPGPIGNLTVRPLNSYSALIRWLSPEEPNGQIVHYIVQIEPQNNEDDDVDDQQRPWTEKVVASSSSSGAGGESAEVSAEGLLVEKVLDGLAGGRRYRLEVWPVNEAGQGRGSGLVQLDVPISKPPRPGQSAEVLSDSIRPQQLRVRIDTAQLSERNGRLIKIALIVAEANENGELEEDELVGEEAGQGVQQQDDGDNGNGTAMPTTWAMARRVPGRWPSFVALEVLATGTRRSQHQKQPNGFRFGQKILSETVGDEAGCEERPATAICNGPLKADTSYRIKLRVFTDSVLWADSPWTELIHTEPSSDESAFGPLFALLFIVFGIFGTFSAFIYIRRQRQHKSVDSLCHCRRGGPSSSNPTGAVVGKFPRHPTPPRSTPQQQQQKQKAANRHHRTNRRQQKQQCQTNEQQRRSKESQWTALKMMMAERAADCLAKLGLDPAAAAASTSNGDGDAIDGASNSSNESPLRAAAHGNVLCGGAPATMSNAATIGDGTNSAQQQSAATLFGTPHHRRSKSLRERTGVDQRLERLPSGPQLRHSMLPWTVMNIKAGIQPDRSRPVQICDFVEHARLMSADSDFRFSEEYEDLRTIGLGQCCIAADLTANRAKNRFTNILPYDHSRVKLKPTDDDDGSDYVNASYIPGFNSRREFIAAQGPLPSTRDHFWRLVWEQQVPAIVALTKCVEKGRDKCHQYWPDNSSRSVLYADIEVTLLTESIEYDEFTIRELRLTNMAEPSQPVRTVQHLHYQAWPDFGVPDHPVGIVHFARLFRNKLPPSSANKPTIVHCSAGVGRSGTFIALDRLVQHIECGRPIDVFGTVYEMRLERCHMVQNEQQYIFIHHCLQYVLENFYPFLLCPSQQSQQHTANRPGSSPNPHAPFSSSISSPICGDYGNGGSSSLLIGTRGDGGGGIGSGWSSRTMLMNNNGNGTANNCCWPPPTSVQSPTAGTMMQPPPKIEVYHPQRNDGFLEDDEGIAESGL